MLLSSFVTICSTIFQFFLLAAAAAVFAKCKIVSESLVQRFTKLTVNIFFPCLIISKITTNFNPAAFSNWWIMPLFGVVLVVLGICLCFLMFGFNPEKRHLFPLASMQNAIYIVLPIGKVLYPDDFDFFAMHCFFLHMGLTPLIWSMGKFFLSNHATIPLTAFVSPPFIATLASIFLVFTNLSHLVSGPLAISIDIVGRATIPLAIFILGFTLGTISMETMPSLGDTFTIASIKFVLLPVFAGFTLYATGLYITQPLMSSVIMIQAASPPATNLILIARNYDGNGQLVSSMLCLQYLIGLFAIPVWIAVRHSLL